MKITLVQGTSPDVQTVEVEMPVVPAYNEYVSHEPSGIAGYVVRVIYEWDSEGLQIEVTLA